MQDVSWSRDAVGHLSHHDCRASRYDAAARAFHADGGVCAPAIGAIEHAAIARHTGRRSRSNMTANVSPLPRPRPVAEPGEGTVITKIPQTQCRARGFVVP